MVLERAQIISVIVNACIILLAVLGTGIFIWKLNFKDKNARLLFILYIVYWMSPLLCREYTGQMHLHMYYIHDYGTMLAIPLLAYGLIGIFWRPLNDIMSYKMKSRKNIIFISLAFQTACIIPFMVYPCFTTNIIQSVGAGIGASGIGLFNLMFSESHHERRIFKTVSIIALPPLIAEIITSAVESTITSLLTENARYDDYVEVMYIIWILALAAIVASFVITFFIKEDKKHLYVGNKFKEPVKTKKDNSVVILISVAALCAVFIKFAVSGPSSVTQLIYMGENAPNSNHLDTRFFEGYLTCLFAIGSLVGIILSGLWLSKSKSEQNTEKIFISLIATILWIVYLTVNGQHPTVRVFFFSTILNGLAYGLIWNLMIGMVVNKFFTKTNIITPIGVLNTFLSVGVCLGTFVNCWFKGPAYDFEAPQAWNEFVVANKMVNNICVVVAIFFFLSICAAYLIHVTYPPKQVLINKNRYKAIGETEI